ERRKLQRAFAWGPKDSVRSRAVSTTTTIRADSLALDLPDEVLTEARAFGHAFSTSKKDSTKNADVDWIAGDSLIARWTQVPDSAPSQPMTAPISPHRVADLMAARDSSLPLAAAALARVADGRGGASLGELAIAYREEFLKLRARSRGAGGGLPELGALSVEQFRATLRSSVLPRLALLKIVEYPVGVLSEGTPITFTGDMWAEVLAERA